MRLSFGKLASLLVVGGGLLALGACAPYEGYDPYAHPNTTSRYLNNSNAYQRPYYGPAYGYSNYPPNYYNPRY